MKQLFFFSFFLLVLMSHFIAQPLQVRNKAMNLPPKSVYKKGFYTGKDWLMQIEEKDVQYLYVNGKKQGICANLADVSPENSLSRIIVVTEKMPQTGFQTTVYFGANKKIENLHFPMIKIDYNQEDTIIECYENPLYLRETHFLTGKILISEDSLHQQKALLNANGKGYSVWITDNKKAIFEKNQHEKSIPYSAEVLQNATASADGKYWTWAAQQGTILAIFFNGNKNFSIPSIGKDSLKVQRIISAPDGKEYAFEAITANEKAKIFFSNQNIKDLGENIVPNTLCYGVFYPKTWSWLSYQAGENPLVRLHHSTRKTDTFPPYFEDNKNLNSPHFIWDSKRKNAILSYNKKLDENSMSQGSAVQNYFFFWKNGKMQKTNPKKVVEMNFDSNGSQYVIEKGYQNGLILRNEKVEMEFWAKNHNLIFTPSGNYWWTYSGEWFDEVNKQNLNPKSVIHYNVATKKAFWLERNNRGEIFLCERELP